MLMCKEATRLISEGLDRRLPLWQRLNLRLHVSMCGACTAYKRQVEAIHRLLRARFGRPSHDHDVQVGPWRLSIPKVDEIKQLLRSAARD